MKTTALPTTSLSTTRRGLRGWAKAVPLLSAAAALLAAVPGHTQSVTAPEAEAPLRVAAISGGQVVFVEGFQLPLAADAVIVNEIEGKRGLTPAQVLPAWAVVQTAPGVKHPIEVRSIRLLREAEAHEVRE